MPVDRKLSNAGLLAFLLFFGGCGSDRVTDGGTNGTEAGNALTARFVLPDGRPAAWARVVARPSDAIDSTSSARWRNQDADAGGVVVLRLPAGSWTLETRFESLGLRSEFGSGNRDSTTELDTLYPSHDLSGHVIGGSSGARIYLPGLAVSVPTGTDGAFLFRDVPHGTQRLLLDDQTWIVPDSLRKGLVLVLGSGQAASRGTLLALPASTLPRRFRLPDSTVPSDPTLMDSAGAAIPLAIGPDRSGYRQIWAGPAPKGVAAIVSGSGTPASPFSAATGILLAWVPELGPNDLTGSNTHFLPDSVAKNDSDAVEGRFLHADLGLSLGALPLTGLPDTGAFALVLRTKLLAQSIGSLWLLNWTDSAQSGLRIGIGAGRLRIVVGALDTSIAVSDSGAWTWWCTGWDGRFLTVWSEGILRMKVEAPGVLDRRTWSAPRIGTGGGLDLGVLLSWGHSVDGAIATESNASGP